MITFYIFTDGSCLNKGNKKFDSSSAYLILNNWENVADNCFRNNDTTSQYGEIFAIYKGLEKVDQIITEENIKDYHIKLFTDSEIYYKALTSWIYKWIKFYKDGVLYKDKTYKTAVKNGEIVLKAFKLVQKLSPKFYHMNSHATSVSINSHHQKFIEKNKINITMNNYLKLVSANDIVDGYAKSIFNK